MDEPARPTRSSLATREGACGQAAARMALTAVPSASRSERATVFSAPAFARAWCAAFPECEVLEASSTTHFVRTPMSYGTWRISTGHCDDFCASVDDVLYARSVVQGLMRMRCRSFAWPVRFDHVELARALDALAVSKRAVRVHTLSLEHGYERVRASYSATARRDAQVGVRRGLVLRTT